VDTCLFPDIKASALTNRYFNGRYWGVPLYGTPTVLVYRKDILKEKGLKVPDTWDDLLETAEKVHRVSIKG
jgi:ABC-type glycerol-3-phosphate transport system substrate-binding protein